MKKIIIFGIVLVVLVLSGCVKSAYVSENQAKDEIIKESTCTDECSQPTCDGLYYIACSTGNDGCKHKQNKEKIKGECGVECLKDSDCSSDKICSANKCKIVYLNVTYDDLKPIFSASSDNTNLQKDKIFNEVYKGKYIIWKGKVRGINKISDNKFKLVVTLKEGPWFDIGGVTDEYVTVYLDKSQYNKIIILKVGDNVTFSGKFDSYTTILIPYFDFTEGKIIS